jgi:putative DNA methylase
VLTDQRAELMPADVHGVVRSPLRHLHADEISAQAKIETRNREVHVPPISAYRWWARRTEAINGAILDAVARDADPETRLLVVDPFVGGGVIPLAAVIRGHRAYAQDLNPWAARGLAGMLGLGAITELAAAADKLASMAKPTLDRAYRTKSADGAEAEISHTFRVAVVDCPKCRRQLRLFPHALVSLKVRREHGSDEAFLACPKGHLFAGRESGVQPCPKCERPTDPAAEYTPRRVAMCPDCGSQTRLEALAKRSTWGWACVLVERVSGGRRELAFPTRAEVRQADEGWEPALRLPQIPSGQETHVLHRHGFRTWNDIYPRRQHVVIEKLLSLTAKACEDETVVQALRLAIIGSAEMAGHLSRWDRFYLKSYESMAGHRFNFTTFAAEPNVWGTKKSGRGTVTRRVHSFEKAAAWLRLNSAGELSIDGPLSATGSIEPMADSTDVRIVEGSSEHLMLPTNSADVALTDPP